MVPSLSVKAALAAGSLVIGERCDIAESVRVLTTEDDGTAFGPVRLSDGVVIREHVILCTGVVIGDKSKVGHGCVLRREARIGANAVISHLVNVERGTVIGNSVRISALTHLTGNCIVEDEVQIGAGVATINDKNMLWPKPPALVAPKFRKGCRIGSGSTILAGIEIGEYTLVGAGSVVTRSLPPKVVAFGNPAYVQKERSWLD